ncbi:MAG TPA: exodeoxyribonuclease V subunit alpha [Solirubrobacteraceae bacterium]|jgi:exodeoxyribonuclease V alpha subunit|nr:exodeoxyribonuclease V subunit alpha [Solirubrobacteraceae bacterium]
MTTTESDPFDVRRARHAPGLLRAFNDAGVLTAADVHVAVRVTGLSGEHDDGVLLAAALAVRAPRLGHVYVDLATIRDTAAVETDEPVDLASLPWPPPGGWVMRVAAGSIVSVGDEEDGCNRPLRLVDSRLYLDRYWREERRVAADLLAFGELGAALVRMDVLRDGLARMFAGQTDGRQCLAAASAVLRRLTVVAGGPGTGKTTTVARIVALLAEQAAAAGAPAPLVALAAPTGKAAARLQDAVHDEAAGLSVHEPVRAQLLALQASTLHRLLGWRPGSHSRFRHHRGQRLPHDVVIVDETSMVSLSLMARLVEAVRPDARLVLVGDPGQLASIEAGAVLGDVVGPCSDALRIGTDARGLLARATGHEVLAHDPPAGATIGDGIVVLDRVHRFGEGIARLVEAIRRGDADAVVDVLREGAEGVTWIDVDVSDAAAQDALSPVRDRAVAAARAVRDAARAGDASDALAALASFRLLCAHRRGPEGVATWTARIEGWLADEIDVDERWYAGRPLLVTANDHELQLYNGDTGVVVQAAAGRVAAAFERRGEIVELSPSRLGSVDTVYAMTIHKSQGSQFATAAVLLPGPASRILTRELLYTAATRARELLIVAGTQEAIRAAVERPVARASGLRRQLWD